jgi:hypothetical protein
VANDLHLPPVITLRGFTIGGGNNFPQHIGQKVYTLRDDLSFSMNMAGRHDLRTGGEYLNYLTWHDWCNFLRGNLIADNGPVPANIEQLFPLDPNGWNMAPLSPISRATTWKPTSSPTRCRCRRSWPATGRSTPTTWPRGSDSPTRSTAGR